MAKKRKPSIRSLPMDSCREGAIQHEDLSDELLALAKYTYKHAGRFIDPTLEQWELGFMRKRDPRRELKWWMQVAVVMQQVKPQDPKKAVAELAACSMQRLPSDGADNELLQIWFNNAGQDGQAVLDHAIREAFEEYGLAPKEFGLDEEAD
jgi:hypothetical protein